jgi:hypothetical protein
MHRLQRSRAERLALEASFSEQLCLLLFQAPLKRVESATGPKILALGFFCPELATGSLTGLKNRPGQALTRFFNESFFGAWFSHGNF